MRLKISAAIVLSALGIGSARADDDTCVALAKEVIGLNLGPFSRVAVLSQQQAVATADMNTCLRLTKNGLYPRLEVDSDGTKFRLTVTWIPNNIDVLNTLNVSLFGPTDLISNSCTITKNNKTVAMTSLNDATQTFHPKDEVIVDCDRRPRSIDIGGKDRTCSDETIFDIATSGPTQSINYSSRMQKSR